MNRALLLGVQVALVVCFVLAGGAEAKVKICQGSQIRAALVSVCDFKRRDVHFTNSNDLVDRYKYKVAEDPMVAIQLSRSFRRNMHSIKVKRHREYALHRKCCINGCTRGDFAGLC